MARKGNTGKALLCSPAASARLAVAREWLATLGPGERALVVVPSAMAGARLCQPLVATDEARFGLQRTTLPELTLQLAIPALAERGRAPADVTAEQALIARALAKLEHRRALGRFAAVHDRPGLPRALGRTLHELSMAGTSTETLAQHDPDLATVRRAYAEELEVAGLIDRGGIFALAAEAVVDRGPQARRPCLWLDVPLRQAREATLARALLGQARSALFTAPTGDSRTLALLEDSLPLARDPISPTLWDDALRRLQANLFEASAPRGSLGGAVTVLSAPGEGRECVEVARRLLLEAQSGTPFDRMAVVMRGSGGYHHLLAEALARAGIPAHFTEGSTRPHPAGRALLSLLHCKREGLSARAFAEYLSLSVTPAPMDEDAGETQAPGGEREKLAWASARRWERLIEDAAVIGGLPRWQRQLEALEHRLAHEVEELERDGGDTRTLERDRAELEQLRGLALPLLQAVDALPERGAWSEWLQALDGLATRALTQPETARAALAQLLPLGALGPVGIDEVLRVLTPLLSELREPPRGDAAGKVLCGSIDRVRGMGFALVCVLGLAEKIFPQKVSEDPVLLDTARGALPDDLEQNPQRIAQERLALRVAVGAADQRVILSYPRVDLERGRPRVPSFYGLEVLRAAEGELPGYGELMRRAEAAASARIGWPAPSKPELAIDEAEHDLSLLHDMLRREDRETRGAARYLLEVNPHLARALRFRARRWSVKRFTAADGLVEPSERARAILEERRLGARAYSPTVLETYASCPYRFALRGLHGLRPRSAPAPIEVIDPRQRGALIHDIQFETLSALRDRGLLPLSELELAEALAIMSECARRIAARYERELAPAIQRVWNDSVSAIQRDLSRWLSRMASDPMQPVHFELAFGYTRLQDRDPHSTKEPAVLTDGTRLSGSIDVVERADGHLRATDHKTGKAVGPDGLVIDGGRTLQPLLYALALERLMPQEQTVDGGRLYYCTADGGFEQRAVVLDERTRAAAGRALAVIDAAIERGFLPAAPDEDACEHCDYRVVCGPYEELRVKRKDHDSLHTLHQLREEP